MTAIGSPVVGPVRRRAPSQAAVIVVVARASRGTASETAPMATRATSRTVPNRPGAARRGRRATSGRMATSLAGTPGTAPIAARPTWPVWASPRRPAWGPLSPGTIHDPGEPAGAGAVADLGRLVRLRCVDATTFPRCPARSPASTCRRIDVSAATWRWAQPDAARLPPGALGPSVLLGRRDRGRGGLGLRPATSCGPRRSCTTSG